MMGTPPLTNFTNMTSSTPTSLPYLGPLFMEYTRVVFYAIISIVGTIGNTLVILAYRNPRMRSVTNLFIANLAVADLTVCLINTPVAVIYSTLKRWPFGLFLCKLINYIQGITVFASVGTLMAIAADRYRAIVHPLLPRIRKRHAITIIVAIWIVASIFPFPLFFYQKLDDRSIFCSEEWPSVEAQKIYTVFVAVALYVIPLTVISLLYFLICHNLNSSQATTQEGATRARKSVIRMLVIVVVLFLVCWLPFHVMTLYQNFKPESARQIVFFQVFMFSLWLMFSNSCCNPIVYAVFNRNYRREFGRLLRCQTRGSKLCGKYPGSLYNKDRRFSSDTRTFLKTATNFLLQRKSKAQEDGSFQNGSNQDSSTTPRIVHGNYSNRSGGITRGNEIPCVESRL
ncbi:unnamed protein product [Porites evermanni]|uniref:G-protein coupled receptors family 1 profile domain-containing protein n=1 Tax=Porites evermanni TaxID=104178 RepID=A0ABN8MSR9_9CNID|nr:unnamed protein product [Porites evermanni]